MHARESRRLPFDPVRSQELPHPQSSPIRSVEAALENPPSLPPSQTPPRPSNPSQSLSNALQIDPNEFPSTQACPVPPGLRDPCERRTDRHRDAPWDTDGDQTHLSSLELLLQWLEIPGNPHRAKNGLGGMTGKEATRRCSIWLQQRGARTFRRQPACMSKINELYRQWEDANAYMKGTGEGEGGREIQDALDTGDPARIAQAEKKVEDKCIEKCPEWLRLKEVFNEAAGGNALLRSDTTQGSQPILTRLQRPVRESASTATQRSFREPTDVSETSVSSGTAANRPFEGLTGTPRGNGREGGGEGGEGSFPRSLADEPDAPRKSHKRRQRSHSFERDIIAGENDFRRKKLEKMTESNQISKGLAAAQTAQAVTATASTIKAANADWDWSRCVREARALMGEFQAVPGGGEGGEGAE